MSPIEPAGSRSEIARTTLAASLVTSGGRSAWFVGVLLLMVYFVFALTLYMLPPQTQ